MSDLRLSDEAEADVFEASEWYAQQRDGLGLEFLAAMLLRCELSTGRPVWDTR